MQYLVHWINEPIFGDAWISNEECQWIDLELWSGLTSNNRTNYFEAQENHANLDVQNKIGKF